MNNKNNTKKQHPFGEFNHSIVPQAHEYMELYSQYK